MSNKYRIHTVGRTHFVQSRPAWWPFWFNREHSDSYAEATHALGLIQALDMGVRVVETPVEERIHAAVEAATATIRGELTKAQARVTELEDHLKELSDKFGYTAPYNG